MSDNDIKKIQLTKEGLEELKAELKQLKEVKLPSVIKRVATARAHGDLSENAEYTDAKEEQQFTETRISEIEDVLERAVVVKQTKSQTKIGVGSSVTVSVVGKTNNHLTFHIVGEFESKPEEGKISSVSPIGNALMGKKKGETIKIDVPAGTIEYTVVEIH